MYVELVNGKKDNAKGEILLLSNPAGEEIEFALYNSGQKSGVFEFIGVMTPELFQKCRRNPDNLNINNSSNLWIDPKKVVQNIDERLIALKGQSVSEPYPLRMDDIKSFLEFNKRYGKQNVVIVYKSLNGEVISGEISLQVSKKNS